MADTNTTEAPVTEEKVQKAPLQKHFEPKGEEYKLDLEAVDPEKPNKIALFQFGIFSTWRDGEDVKKSGRYQVTLPVVVDGMAQDVVTLGADPARALAMAIKQATNNVMSDEDYTFDMDDDFFKQKYTAPKADNDDVWTSNKFAENRDRLSELSGEAEEVLDSRSDAQRATQQESFRLAAILSEVFELVGNSRKALEAWARGSEGSNFPQLAKLGKGKHALYEAMSFASLSDTLRELLPETLTSGKALERHRSVSIDRMVEPVVGHKLEWPADYEMAKTGRYPTIEGVAAIIRCVAGKSIGVRDVDNKDLDAIVDEATDLVTTHIAEYNVEHGKSVNTHNKAEYTASLTAYGCAVLLDPGSRPLMREAVDGLTELSTLEGEELRTGLGKLIQGNLFLSKAVKVAWAHKVQTEREGENREVMQNIEGDDDIVTKKARTSFAKLDALPAAAHLFKLLCTHGDASEVWYNLKALASQHSEALTKPATDEGDSE